MTEIPAVLAGLVGKPLSSAYSPSGLAMSKALGMVPMAEPLPLSNALGMLAATGYQWNEADLTYGLPPTHSTPSSCLTLQGWYDQQAAAQGEGLSLWLTGTVGPLTQAEAVAAEAKAYALTDWASYLGHLHTEAKGTDLAEARAEAKAVALGSQVAAAVARCMAARVKRADSAKVSRAEAQAVAEAAANGSTGTGVGRKAKVLSNGWEDEAGSKRHTDQGLTDLPHGGYMLLHGQGDYLGMAPEDEESLRAELAAWHLANPGH